SLVSMRNVSQLALTPGAVRDNCLFSKLVESAHVDVAATSKHSCDGDILVEGFPMEPYAAQFDLSPLCGRCAQKPRKPCERNTKRPSVAQLNPHRVLVKPDTGSRNAHAANCSPDGA